MKSDSQQELAFGIGAPSVRFGLFSSNPSSKSLLRRICHRHGVAKRLRPV